MDPSTLSLASYDLVRTGGCADIVFYARAQDGAAFLEVVAGGLLAQALTSGETEVTTISLPDAAAKIRFQVGSFMTQPCDDVLRPQETIEALYDPVSGTAVITVEPGDPSAPEWEVRGRATLELYDLVLEAGSEQLLVDEYILSDVAVGWAPG